MNGFIEEVCTQGMLLKRYLKEYWPVDREVVDAIAECFKSKAMNRVILTGMGSSLYAIDAVRSYLTGHGIPALAFSSFELSRFQFNQIDSRCLVIIISQSGKSPEVVEIAKKAAQITTVVGIHNYEESPLKEECGFMLQIHADKEYSVTNKTYELTMLILNLVARRLTGELDQGFMEECRKTADWACRWLENWEENTRPMFEFAQGTLLYDLLANDASLATARQLSLAYREGLHNCTAVWECADYAHGQYHSSKLGAKYLAQMFFPDFLEGTKEMKMKDYILDHGGKAMLYTCTPIKPQENLMVVRLPRVQDSLMPLVESIAAETFLGMLYGPDWVKDH